MTGIGPVVPYISQSITTILVYIVLAPMANFEIRPVVAYIYLTLCYNHISMIVSLVLAPMAGFESRPVVLYISYSITTI